MIFRMSSSFREMDTTVRKGLCMSMCSQEEIKLRERENLLHPFETAPGHTRKRPKADYRKCVKEYKRPTVGKQEVDVYDLRPANVLVDTVDYLVDSIATRGVQWNEIYDFMFDRLRSVRQDLVIQELHGAETIHILEKVIRFHIYSDYRLCMEHISLFDQKINNQHTQECLKRLINLYKNWSSSHIENKEWETSQTERREFQDGCCKNQAEFEATYLLFNLGDAVALNHFYTLDKNLRYNPTVRNAYNMSCAYLLNNWCRVFKLVKRLSSPVHLCVVSRHFPALQRSALYSCNIGYSSKNLKFPLDKLTELLFLNTDTETQHLCVKAGLNIVGTAVHFLKTSYRDDEKLERSHSDYVTQRVRQWSIPDLLHGNMGQRNPGLQNVTEMNAKFQQDQADSFTKDFYEQCNV